MFYKFARALAGFILRIWFKVECTGEENHPATGGYIVCCNHRSLLDPVFLAIKTKPQIHYMAKEELFKNKLLGFLFRHVGAFPVERGKGDMSAIDKSIAIVQSGKVLGLFPEGTRSKTDALLRFKSGVAVVAAKSGGDVLPAAIWYSGKHFRARVIVRFGKPIPKSELYFEQDSTRHVRAAVARLQQEIGQLLEEIKGAN